MITTKESLVVINALAQVVITQPASAQRRLAPFPNRYDTVESDICFTNLNSKTTGACIKTSPAGFDGTSRSVHKAPSASRQENRSTTIRPFCTNLWFLSRDLHNAPPLQNSPVPASSARTRPRSCSRCSKPNPFQFRAQIPQITSAAQIWPHKLN